MLTRRMPDAPGTLDLFTRDQEASGVGRLVSIHVSNGGVPKLEVPSARVTEDGVVGDRQRNLKYHGGPERAVCLYSHERIEALRAEGHPIRPGSIGENLLIAGIDWARMVPGVRARIGEVEIELTSYALPCRNIRASFRAGRISRVSPKSHPGWSRVYARVTSGGVLALGDAVGLL